MPESSNEWARPADAPDVDRERTVFIDGAPAVLVETLHNGNMTDYTLLTVRGEGVRTVFDTEKLREQTGATDADALDAPAMRYHLRGVLACMTMPNGQPFLALGDDTD